MNEVYNIIIVILFSVVLILLNKVYVISKENKIKDDILKKFNKIIENGLQEGK